MKRLLLTLTTVCLCACVSILATAETVPRYEEASYQAESDSLSFQFDSFSGTWNDDRSVLTNADSSVSFGIAGLQPGAVYYAALVGKDVWGQSYCLYIDLDYYETTATGCIRQLASLPGTYKNLTLAVTGNGETISHTFTYRFLGGDKTEYNYVLGPVFGNVDNSYLHLACPEDATVLRSGLSNTSHIITIPCQGSVYSGHILCRVLPIRYTGEYADTDIISFTLTQVNTGEIIASVERQGQYCYGRDNLAIYNDIPSGDYCLTMSQNGETLESVTFTINWTESPQAALMALASQTQETLSTIDISNAIRDFAATLSTFDTDAFQGFLRYQYAQEHESPIGSFAICSPNVKATEAAVDRADDLHTANWTLRDMFLFQQTDMPYYSDREILDLDALNAFFGDKWKDLKSFAFASGTSKGEDGTLYTWLPVYFPTEDGGILDDRVYLFIYILYQGADTDYLDSLGYFRPEFYNEHHTSRMFIADQVCVAQMLQTLRGTDDFEIALGNTAYYPTLQLDDESTISADPGTRWYLAQLQQRLRELGYIQKETSELKLDAVTQDAIKAYEQDMGLEADGIADLAMQRMLYDNTPEKKLLCDWLDSHGSRREEK